MSFSQAVAELARPGLTGIGPLRQILNERALGRERPESMLESRMALLLRTHGLPRAAYQHQIHVDGELVARVDFAYPERRTAIEVDGFEVHSSPRALQADLQRQNRLAVLGWTVLRFTWADVVRRPRAVAMTICAALERVGPDGSDRAGGEAG